MEDPAKVSLNNLYFIDFDRESRDSFCFFQKIIYKMLINSRKFFNNVKLK